MYTVKPPFGIVADIFRVIAINFLDTFIPGEFVGSDLPVPNRITCCFSHDIIAFLGFLYFSIGVLYTIEIRVITDIILYDEIPQDKSGKRNKHKIPQQMKE